jgi:hypothetical protein
MNITFAPGVIPKFIIIASGITAFKLLQKMMKIFNLD